MYMLYKNCKYVCEMDSKNWGVGVWGLNYQQVHQKVNGASAHGGELYSLIAVGTNDFL